MVRSYLEYQCVECEGRLLIDSSPDDYEFKEPKDCPYCKDIDALILNSKYKVQLLSSIDIGINHAGYFDIGETTCLENGCLYESFDTRNDLIYIDFTEEG